MSKQIAPPHAKQQYVAHQAAQATIQAHAGPLPNPETLAQYNNIIPDGAERIMKMAESQALHRQDLEQYMVRTNSRLAYFGVSSAFVISMTAILCGFYLVLNGNPISGTTFTGMGLSGLTATFIYGTQSQREERQRRNAVNQAIAQRGQMQ